MGKAAVAIDLKYPLIEQWFKGGIEAWRTEIFESILEKYTTQTKLTYLGKTPVETKKILYISSLWHEFAFTWENDGFIVTYDGGWMNEIGLRTGKDLRVEFVFIRSILKEIRW